METQPTRLPLLTHRFLEEAPGGGDGVRLVCKWAERGSMTLNVIRLAIEVGLFLLETVNLYLRFKR
jgi:hypothetical protein